MHLRLYLLFIALCVASPALAEQGTDDDCGVAQTKIYLQSHMALLNEAPLGGLTIDQLIAERRLQEGYCLAIAKCIVGADPASNQLSPTMSAIDVAAKFDDCLRDEALEKYRDK